MYDLPVYTTMEHPRLCSASVLVDQKLSLTDGDTGGLLPFHQAWFYWYWYHAGTGDGANIGNNTGTRVSTGTSSARRMAYSGTPCKNSHLKDPGLVCKT